MSGDRFFRFGFGLPVSLMCRGVYVWKNNLTHVLRKMKASSTNWLIWIISLKLCLANIKSRLCQIRGRDTLGASFESTQDNIAKKQILKNQQKKSFAFQRIEALLRSKFEFCCYPDRKKIFEISAAVLSTKFYFGVNWSTRSHFVMWIWKNEQFFLLFLRSQLTLFTLALQPP